MKLLESKNLSIRDGEAKYSAPLRRLRKPQYSSHGGTNAVFAYECGQYIAGHPEVLFTFQRYIVPVPVHCTVIIMHLSSCIFMYSRIVSLFLHLGNLIRNIDWCLFFRRLKINPVSLFLILTPSPTLFMPSRKS
jgi:hypothetical protein